MQRQLVRSLTIALSVAIGGIVVARLLGYPPGDAAQALEQDYRRAARRARTVMEPLFYG